MPLKHQNSSSKVFLYKYFWEGQEIDEKLLIKDKDIPDEATWEERFLIKHRKFVAFFIPFTLSQTFYWLTAWRYDYIPLFTKHWEMPVVMIIGSLIAGMTSAGGGAVAFPVMTFVLNMTPEDARDFSIMIQAIGMSMATFTIIFMRIQIDWRAIIYSTLGAVPGVIFGFEILDPLFTADEKKMKFVAVFAAFAICLYMLNREHDRKTFPVIQDCKPWKTLILLVTGFIGGLLSVFCFYWRGVFMADIKKLPFRYLKVCVPIVITFAPLGSFLGSHFHRLVLAWVLYMDLFLSMIGFLLSKPELSVIVGGIIIVVLSMIFFILMSMLGDYLVKKKRDLEFCTCHL